MIQSPNTSRKANTVTNSQLPVCQRTLSFKKDGAKYYTPVSLIQDNKIKSPEEIKELFLDFLNLFLEDEPLPTDKIASYNIRLKRRLIDLYYDQNPKIGILKDWLDVTNDLIKNDILSDQISSEMKLTQDNIRIRVQLNYRNSMSQEDNSGIFHEDGQNDLKPIIQILYPLDNSEMGTLFVPNIHKQCFKDTHTIDTKYLENTTKVYKEKTRIGIVEQADPNKMIAMLRYKHNNSVIHAVPNNINRSSNPVRRPLLIFFVYKKS